MKATHNTEKLLACAVAAARAAGEHALHNTDRRTEIARKCRHDVKLRLDMECQRIAERTILERFPSHAVLGEEDEPGRRRKSDATALEWIIDPIDGTVNYSHGLPVWCCSIAVRTGDRALAGAVYAPARDELFTATADGPALLNGSPIRVSEVSDLSASIVFTGADKSVEPGLPAFETFRRIAAAVQRPRITGSAALDICSVAAGRGEGYFERGIFIWDAAAASLVVARAGGKAELLGAGPGHRIEMLATNGLIHEALKQVLGEDRPRLSECGA